MIDPQQVFGLKDSHLAKTADGFLLHESAMADFQAMQTSAKANGIQIAIASSFRSFERQLLIWNNKFNGLRPVFDKTGKQLDMNELDEWQKVQAILLYSAIPGTSRHHWGTDVDIYDAAAVNSDYRLKLEPQEYEAGGPFHNVTNWLSSHMSKFHFYRPYAEDLGGVAPELWHLSHKITASDYAKTFAQSEQTLLDILSEQQIAGFSAIEQHFDYILDKYVYSVPNN